VLGEIGAVLAGYAGDERCGHWGHLLAAALGIRTWSLSYCSGRGSGCRGSGDGRGAAGAALAHLIDRLFGEIFFSANLEEAVLVD